MTTYEQQLRVEHRERQARFATAALAKHFVPILRASGLAPITPEMFAEAHRIIDSGAVINRMDIVQRAVAAKFGVTIPELKSIRQGNRIVIPRQLAMFICKEMTSKSLPEIGRAFGGRHHTTVMHALDRVEQRMADPAFAKIVDEIRETLA